MFAYGDPLNGPLSPLPPPSFPHLHPEHAGVCSVPICITMSTGTEEGGLTLALSHCIKTLEKLEGKSPLNLPVLNPPLVKYFHFLSPLITLT